VADARIKYVSRSSNTHESITSVGSDNWEWETHMVIQSIDNGTNTFYTEVSGKRANVGVVNGRTCRHLQTHADGYYNNNLLALPDFPHKVNKSAARR
jgi:hypothetical protein